jgi:hypothetical protein
MDPEWLTNLQEHAARLAEHALAVRELLGQAGDLDLDPDEADAWLLTLGSAQEDVAAVESRLREALPPRGGAGGSG